MKRITIVFLLLLMGCSEGTREPVVVTIYQIEPEVTSWSRRSCSADYKTYVRTDDGRTDYLCGKWGAIGQKISGYWVTGHWDVSVNGFRRI